ncbi:MAG: alpha/beta hydrolase [Ignavibacteria bacterium]|nr:alpha/beta hydrolase [Ignavibacteria bacterium]
MSININDLSVFTVGEKKNTPFVLVHGFPFNHSMWDEQIKELSKQYYCVTYDIRGLGESSAGDGQFTMESFVDDLEIIVNELELKKSILCGLSMGGYISLRAVERMEVKFSTLILCDTKSDPDNSEGKLKRAIGIKMINEEGVEKFVRQFVPNCFSENFMATHKEEYKSVINKSQLNSSTGVKGCLLAMAGRTDTTPFLQKISIPTLVICGEKDKLTPPAVMKSMANNINNSEFIIVRGAGHMAPFESAKIVNQKIKEFLMR